METKQAGNTFPTEAAEAGHAGEVRRRWGVQARPSVGMGTSADSLAPRGWQEFGRDCTLKPSEAAHLGQEA